MSVVSIVTLVVIVVVSGAIAVVLAAAKKLAVDELCGLVMVLSRLLIDCAAKRLPCERDRWQQEWLAELDELDREGRRLSALLWAAGHLRGARTMSAEAKAVAAGRDPYVESDRPAVQLDSKVIAEIVQRLVDKSAQIPRPSLGHKSADYDVVDEIARINARFAQLLDDTRTCEPYRDWTAKAEVRTAGRPMLVYDPQETESRAEALDRLEAASHERYEIARNEWESKLFRPKERRWRIWRRL
jgi:hypothetical protein